MGAWYDMNMKITNFAAGHGDGKGLLGALVRHSTCIYKIKKYTKIDPYLSKHDFVNVFDYDISDYMSRFYMCSKLNNGIIIMFEYRHSDGLRGA